MWKGSESIDSKMRDGVTVVVKTDGVYSLLYVSFVSCYISLLETLPSFINVL